MQIESCSLADCYDLAATMRPSDTAEVEASMGVSPLEALLQGRATSHICKTAKGDSGEPVVIFGVGEVDFSDQIGQVWMLCSKDVKRYSKEILRLTPDILGHWHQMYPILWNFVDARNTSSQRWLKRMGFDLIRTHPVFGHAGLPFIEFMRRSPCAPQHS